MTDEPGCSTLKKPPASITRFIRKALLRASRVCSRVNGSHMLKPAGCCFDLNVGFLRVPYVLQGVPACQSEMTPRAAKLAAWWKVLSSNKSPNCILRPSTSKPSWTRKPAASWANDQLPSLRNNSMQSNRMPSESEQGILRTTSRSEGWMEGMGSSNDSPKDDNTLAAGVSNWV